MQKLWVYLEKITETLDKSKENLGNKLSNIKMSYTKFNTMCKN